MVGTKYYLLKIYIKHDIIDNNNLLCVGTFETFVIKNNNSKLNNKCICNLN